MIEMTALGDLLAPARVRRAGQNIYPILSMTMHSGLVDQGTKFKKRIASADTAQYKVVGRHQLVVGFPIDEGVLSFQALHDEAVVSPAYDVWNLAAGASIEPSYLERYLRSPRALSYYRTKLRGSTARRRSLPADVFLGLLVPVPSLPEQRRIAAILDQADALRAKRRQALARLDALTQTIFIEMFGDPATNPEGWPTATLSQLCEAGGEYGAGVPSKEYDDTLPRYIRITDLTANGDLTDEPVSPAGDPRDWERYELEEGDVLFARSGATVGKTYLHRDGGPPAVFAGYLIRFKPLREILSPNYLFQLTQGGAYHAWVAARQRVVAQPNINAQQYGNELTLPVPPVELQTAFGEVCSSVHRLKNKVTSAASSHDTLFASLQHRAFRGEL